MLVSIAPCTVCHLKYLCSNLATLFFCTTLGVLVAVVFVINLLKRHPNCRVLLHRKNVEEYISPFSEDPYDMTQEDPACSNALDSSLWELKVTGHSISSSCYSILYHVVLWNTFPQTLETHFLPAVSKLVKRVLTPETIFSDAELDLSKYLDMDDDKVRAACNVIIVVNVIILLTMMQLFNEACKMTDVATVPMNSNEPSSLWQPGELWWTLLWKCYY